MIAKSSAYAVELVRTLDVQNWNAQFLLQSTKYCFKEVQEHSGVEGITLDGPSCYEYGLGLSEVGADESGGYFGDDVAIKAHDMGEIA